MCLKSFWSFCLKMALGLLGLSLMIFLTESKNVTAGVSKQEKENKTNNGASSLALNKTENVTASSDGISVTIYTLKHFYGIPFSISADKNCTNIPWYLYKKASSVDTHDKCVVIFSRQDCEGRKIIIAPGTLGHSNLGDVDFDKTAASAKSCDPEDINTLSKTNTTVTENGN